MTIMTKIADAIESLNVRLLAAQEEACQYLCGFLPEDLGYLIDVIDQELTCLDPWDCDKDEPVDGYSAVELLRQLDLDAGVWMFEGAKHYEINVMEIFAAFAFARANEGRDILSKEPSIDGYVAASELCADAFAALHYGHEASRRAAPVAQQELQAFTLSGRGVKGGVGKREDWKKHEGQFIVEQLEKIQQSGKTVLTFGTDRNGKLQKFRVILGGRINVDACARYIDERFHGRMRCKFGYIRKTIKNHLADTNAEETQEQTVEIVKIEEDTECNIYPTKYPTTCVAEA